MRFFKILYLEQCSSVHFVKQDWPEFMLCNNIHLHGLNIVDGVVLWTRKDLTSLGQGCENAFGAWNNLGFYTNEGNIHWQVHSRNKSYFDLSFEKTYFLYFWVLLLWMTGTQDRIKMYLCGKYFFLLKES